MKRPVHPPAAEPRAAGTRPDRPASRGDESLSLKRFVAPRYWPNWLLWLGLIGVSRLPFGMQLALGRALGRLLPLFMRRQRRIARRNLAACFPELSCADRARLLDRHFAAVAMSFIEMGIGWFSPIERLRELVRIEGSEHIEAARRGNRGVLLLTAHFTPLEVGVAVFEDLCPGIAYMYRGQRNPMIDTMIRRGRSRFAGEQIPRENVRALLRALRAGRVVAYLPDQTHVGNQSELLPFFGEPAMTNVAVSKLARIGNAVVLPYLLKRLPGREGYLVTILPPLEGVPSTDPVADTRRWLLLLEAHIRSAPEQYLWLYKKFKGRPAPLPDLYAGL